MEERETFGDDERFKLSFLIRLLHDLRLDGVCSDEPEDQHRLGLPDSVSAILSLGVHLWVLP
jgi:hypothetical protein